MGLSVIQIAKTESGAFWFILANLLIPPISPMRLVRILTRFVESTAALRLR